MQITRITKKANRVYQPMFFQMATLEEMVVKEQEGETLQFYDDMYLMVWVLQATGQAHIDVNRFDLMANTAYYARPGQIIRLKLADDAQGYAFSFAKEFIEFSEMKSSELFHSSLFNPFGVVPAMAISDQALAPMVAVAEKIVQEYQSALDLRSEILKGFLKIFLIYLCRQINPEQEAGFWSRKTDLTRLFFGELERHYTTKKLVKEYAEILAVSPSWLNDVVREISGFTASHHIQQRIVLEAKRKALLNGFSLKEAAYDLGFGDPSHFSKYFKNSSGVNFTDFKKGVSNFC